jgi:hypothetical protein
VENIDQRISEAMLEAEHNAWDSLSRYKFQMFGYWAAIWVHLNRISGAKQGNPFRLLVAQAKGAIGPHEPQDDCELYASVHTSIAGPPETLTSKPDFRAGTHPTGTPHGEGKLRP